MKFLEKFFGRPETSLDTDDNNPDDRMAARPNIELPTDFDTEADFLSHMRVEFYEDIQYDRLNREAAIEDTRFMIGDQWDDFVRQRREAARKPVLTVNRLPAFVAQVVGQRRLNETNIKIVADQGATKEKAKVREGLIRAIQKDSRADLAYDKALETQTICGIGNFSVELDYENDDVFEQKIVIAPRPDALSVVWDRMVMDPTGKDATHVFDVETMKKDAFYKKWPWATPADIVVDVTLRGDLRMNGWIAIDDVRVVRYWRIRTRKRTIAMLNSGDVVDLTDIADENNPTFNAQKATETLSNVAVRSDGSPIMREVNKPYAEMYLCSGLDILEGPYRLDIPRVPMLRVPGWEVTIGEWKHRWGLIRFMKDPQRLHNFWRSVAAEKLMQTPRGVWMAAASAVLGREAAWRNSHLSDDPLLIWNDDSGQKPERIPPAQLENALLEMAEITTQDLKDVSNIHEANLGMPSNEVSGAAIMARQRVSDTGTIIYHDNLTLAQEEAGRIMNFLIDMVYDTPRIVKVIGDDAAELMVAINQIGQDGTDITGGKYSVTVTTGPNSATKRLESIEFIKGLMSAAPQTISLVLDLLVQNYDVPGADEIARRLRLALPPGLLDPKTMTPEEQQRAQSVQSAQAQQQDFQMKAAIAAYLKTSSETALNTAKAQQASETAAAIPLKEQTNAVDAASQAADRELRGHLEAIRVADGK